MTKSEQAREILRYWSYIDRARKVGFRVPDKWLKYGEPSNNALEIVAINLDAISDKLSNIFEGDNTLYKYLTR